MNKTILIILVIAGVIALVAGAAVGGFFYGKSYERDQANSIRDKFMSERGIEGFDPNAVPMGGIIQEFNAAPGNDMNAGGFPGEGMGRGASGEVKSTDGSTFTLAAGDTETKVTLSDETKIIKSTSGTIADITPGLQLMVIGERDDEGNITASQVTILSTLDSQP